MIRINLLPFRAAKKKENIKRQISVYFLSTFFLLTLMGFLFLKINSEITNLKEEEKGLQTELNDLDKIIKRISELEKKTKELHAKLDVIRTLEKNKSGPVHLLEEIAAAVPKEKLWLTSLKESKGSLSLQGTAMDNETVALFMVMLEESHYISNVELQSVKLRFLPDIKLRVSDFVLECKTYAYKEAPGAVPAKGTKR